MIRVHEHLLLHLDSRTSARAMAMRALEIQCCVYNDALFNIRRAIGELNLKLDHNKSIYVHIQRLKDAQDTLYILLHDCEAILEAFR